MTSIFCSAWPRPAAMPPWDMFIQSVRRATSCGAPTLLTVHLSMFLLPDAWMRNASAGQRQKWQPLPCHQQPEAILPTPMRPLPRRRKLPWTLQVSLDVAAKARLGRCHEGAPRTLQRGRAASGRCRKGTWRCLGGARRRLLRGQQGHCTVIGYYWRGWTKVSRAGAACHELRTRRGDNRRLENDGCGACARRAEHCERCWPRISRPRGRRHLAKRPGFAAQVVTDALEPALNWR